ncbi:MAG: glycine zipper 2TM domain-containing protein [Betaproteobacteria bacterium]|jgi:uncharacterized protein YcfJ|nr:glycine zipper 2TM domain-containing protein [Betaproteobacteria bacterium]MDH5341714.1 glycine zipper 2TM domain-containing protein [Betaproteobacteria bacterium]
MSKPRLPVIAAMLIAAPAYATDFTDTATVVSATPIVERVREPRQECTPEAPQPQRATQAERSVIAPIIGGVAGALLGSTIGRGSGRDAATAAGAIAGTIIGDRVANPDSDRSMTGSVVGGAAGGLLGAQVGNGNGRTAAAGAGAIAGAVAGDRIDNRQTASASPAQHCRTVDAIREVVRGYTVVYQYNGRDITTTMPYDPGATVRVGITAIDGNTATPAPTAAMMGGNVRDAGPAASNVAQPAGRQAQSSNYSYRY